MKKVGLGVIGLMCGVILFGTTAWAQTYSSVSLIVTQDGSKYTVSNYSALSGYKVSSTSKGSDVLTIKVSAGSGNSWSSKIKKSNVVIFGDFSDGDVKELTRNSDSQIVIKLDISEDTDAASYSVETDDKDSVTVSNPKSTSSSSSSSSSNKSSKSTVIDDVVLNKETGRVTWDGDADEYDLILYKDAKVVRNCSTKKCHYDFHEYFVGAGSYCVSVRADNGTDNRGNYVISNTLTVTDTEAAAIKANIFGTETLTDSETETGTGSSLTTLSPTSNEYGQWYKDDKGWWYLNSDNSYTVNNWQYIGEKWYYFDQSGYMYTGWLPWQGAYYYMSEYGMLTSTWTPDGYYVGADGKWLQALGNNGTIVQQSQSAYDVTSSMILGTNQ